MIALNFFLHENSHCKSLGQNGQIFSVCLCVHMWFCVCRYLWKVSMLEEIEWRRKNKKNSPKESLILSKMLGYVGMCNQWLFCTNTNIGFPHYPKVHFMSLDFYESPSVPVFANWKKSEENFFAFTRWLMALYKENYILIRKFSLKITTEKQVKFPREF